MMEKFSGALNLLCKVMTPICAVMAAYDALHGNYERATYNLVLAVFLKQNIR